MGPGDLEQTTTLDGRNKLRKLQKSWNICPRDWAGLRIRATLEVMKGKYMFEVEVWSVLCDFIVGLQVISWGGQVDLSRFLPVLELFDLMTVVEFLYFL